MAALWWGVEEEVALTGQVSTDCKARGEGLGEGSLVGKELARRARKEPLQPVGMCEIAGFYCWCKEVKKTRILFLKRGLAGE